MITVVVVNFNDSKSVIKFLNRIVDYDTIKHVIIVDNCSNDGSMDVLRCYAKGKVNLLVTDKNGGYGYGNNIGICYAIKHYKSEHIVISNPDVIFSENTLLELEKILIEHNDVAIAAPFMRSRDGEKVKLTAWRVPTALQYLLFSTRFFKNFLPTFTYEDITEWNEKFVEVECVAGSMLMVNSKLMHKYGMYDNDIFLYCEETVLGIKLLKAGCKTLLLPNESFVHYHSVSINKSINSELDRRKLMLKSRIIVLKKYYKFGKLKLALAKIFFWLSLLIDSNICSLIKGKFPKYF